MAAKPGDSSYVIAIDGHASCGKSTLAKRLAAHFGLLYVDSGAMYRAVTYYLLQAGIAPGDTDKVIASLPQIRIEFRRDADKQVCFLNGVEVEQAIRGMQVNEWVSTVASIAEVRTMLVEQQRQLGAAHGVVMDGRDIGTVVFPNADAKLFLTASPEVRARRRWSELQMAGDTTSFEEVLRNVQHRDQTDSQRSVAPLVQAKDAVLLDNSELDLDETFEAALLLVQLRLGK